MPSSKLKVAIADVLKEEGFIEDCKVKATPSLTGTASEVFQATAVVESISV